MIDKIPEGGTIRIQHGTHRMSRSLTIDKTIHFVGETENPADVILESDVDDDFVTITNGNATFHHLSFKAIGAKADYIQGAVWVTGGVPEFFQCDLVSQNNGGIVITNSGNPLVVSCKIHDCGGSGIVVYSKGLGKFRNCEVFGNAYSGILVTTEGNPTVEKCTFRDNKGGGIFVFEQSRGTFRNNTLSNNLYEGNVMNWYIASDAGLVICTDNNPEPMTKEVEDFCELYGTNVKAVDKDGWTLLHRAARDENVEVVKFLIEKGTDIAILHTVNKLTFLRFWNL